MTPDNDARRGLERMQQQSEKLLGEDRQPEASDDPMEVLGRRIARVLSIAIAVGLILYLWHTYL
jgi:hypothetical protein